MKSFLKRLKMVRIVSWNVLYRKYEERYNPNSLILHEYPEEFLRVIQIVAFIYNQMTKDTIVCLQEVSSMLLDALTSVFKHSHRIFDYQDSREDFLVIIAPNNFYLDFCLSHKTSNGYISITDGNINVITCHLIPQRFISRNTNVLEYLRNLCKSNRKTFIAGDFNEQYKIVKSKLDNDFICPYYGKTYKRKALDHIIFKSSIEDKYLVNKIDNEFLSDHDMIVLEIEL